jgi:maltooligosyltrehalose trehalohydrolase
VSALPWEQPLGARALEDGTCEFRVWAPSADSVALRVGDFDTPMTDAGLGVHEVTATANAGDDYWFVLDGSPFPDPATRWQPHGLRGPSRVFAAPSPLAGRPATLGELVLYELHVGTFTPEGTFEAAIPHLRELAELGITAVEIMPVAEFPGAHGWGYDGVYISAAHSSYGGPFGLLALIRAAHDAGLAVILDVVYNHVGTSGVGTLEAFGPYFTEKYETPWGRAMNYDDADSDPVREWVLQSAAGWVRDFGLDGLRLDAIHAIFDSSAEHIVEAVARRVHEVDPRALVIAESGLNDPRVMRPVGRGGHGCDSAWADDFHHSLRALLTEERDGYYVDFGRVAQLAKAYHRPHVHDGSYSAFRRRRFGAPADDIPPEGFVVFSQNHDQVGNRAFGDRMPAEGRPLAAFCTLLAPFVPMLFMGEEYGEPAPFQFFSDHIDRNIAEATREGRRKEFAAFAHFAGEEVPDPQDPQTFARSKLTRQRDDALAGLYSRLLAARRELPPGDADAIEFDEQARWLRMRRGHFELVCNFARLVSRVPCRGTSVVICTHAEPAISDGYVALPSMSGALIT